MKLSEQTLTILKNFATINQSVVLKPGKEIRTISPQKSVMAIATIPDEIPGAACIYDLSRFLSTYNLYEKPDVEFKERNFVISEGKSRTKFTFADLSAVIAPPDKEIKVPSIDLEVDIKWTQLQSIIKASGVLQLPEIAFIGEDGILYLRAIDSNNPTANNSDIELGTTSDTFTLIIKTENIKLLPRDYNVVLSFKGSKGISKFESEDVKYFIAIESKSTYTKTAKNGDDE